MKDGEEVAANSALIFKLFVESQAMKTKQESCYEVMLCSIDRVYREGVYRHYSSALRKQNQLLKEQEILNPDLVRVGETAVYINKITLEDYIRHKERQKMTPLQIKFNQQRIKDLREEVRKGLIKLSKGNCGGCSIVVDKTKKTYLYEAVYLVLYDFDEDFSFEIINDIGKVDDDLLDENIFAYSACLCIKPKKEMLEYLKSEECLNMVMDHLNEDITSSFRMMRGINR